MSGRPVILCALEHERAVLARRLGRCARIIRAGPGPRRAEEAVERLAAENADPPAVILAGLAGALRPIEGAHWIAEVRNRAGDHWTPTLDLGQRCTDSLIALGVETPVLEPEAKRSVRRDTSADLVDCESHAFARACAARGVAWAVVRGVSDAAHESLPAETLRWIDRSGRTRYARAALDLASRPRLIGDARRLARRASQAMNAVADLLAAALECAPNASPARPAPPAPVSEPRS